MKSSTERAVDELIASLSESDGDDFAQARELLAPAHLDVLNELAVAALVSAARQARRRTTLGAERRAARPVRTPEEQARMDEFRAESERVEGEHRDRLNAGLMRIAEEYTKAVRTEWTAELLASSFTMKDGRIVTWGNATIADHEERVQMFAGMTTAGVEGMSRHLQALEELRARNASGLLEMVGVAA